MSPENIIVLGASGFIGGHLFRTLSVDPQFQVLGASSRACDLLEPASVRAFFRGVPAPSTVIFCSSITKEAKGVHDFNANIKMAENFLEATKGCDLKQVIYLSSVDVYGRPPAQLPITESTPVIAKEGYGRSKAAAEQILKQGLTSPLAILRLPGVYGPGDKGRSVVARFARLIAEGQTITLSGDGTQRRDFLFVRDLELLIPKLMARNWAGTLNVCSGAAASLLQIIGWIEAALAKPADLQFDRGQPQDFHLEFDCRTLASYFPDHRMTSMADGIHTFLTKT